MRKVLIGTPCHDGRTDVWYNDSLNQTIRMAARINNLQLDVVYMSFDSLVQRARNDLVKLAIDHGFDDLIFIDSDQGWEPQWIFTLLDHQVDVVGVAVPKKNDTKELYNVRINHLERFQKLNSWARPCRDLIQVDGIGTGMIRLSRKALLALWETSDMYRNEGRESRMVFDVKIIDGELVSEDNIACTKLQELGFGIYVDRTMTCSHVGPKKWTGDFSAYLEIQIHLMQQQQLKQA